jgi:SAM-dependent methyltransferase
VLGGDKASRAAAPSDFWLILAKSMRKNRPLHLNLKHDAIAHCLYFICYYTFVISPFLHLVPLETSRDVPESVRDLGCAHFLVWRAAWGSALKAALTYNQGFRYIREFGRAGIFVDTKPSHIGRGRGRAHDALQSLNDSTKRFH